MSECVIAGIIAGVFLIFIIPLNIICSIMWENYEIRKIAEKLRHKYDW